MNATTVAVDLAKNVFELAVADIESRVVERCRLTRSQFERWFANRRVGVVVMEACGSAHHWGRWLRAKGIAVKLLPARYVRPYVRRSKTDAADCLALLEAARAVDIVPVRVKSLERQALQGLHRIRSGWMAARTARINTLRGLCREFGLVVPPGARTGLEQMARELADEHSPIPTLVRGTMKLLLEEIRLLEARIGQLERELAALASQTEACRRLLTIPGVGLLTATAMVAAVGDITGFKSARHFACWLGLTPREFSSGDTRRMGRISKCGDTYLRMLLVHGARAVLRSAVVAGRVSVDRWTGCASGPCRSRAGPVTTRLRWRSRTSSPASSGRPGITDRISSAASRSTSPSDRKPACLGCRETDRPHGHNGRTNAATRR